MIPKGGSMKIMRAYKYRLYPTAEQEARLSAWVAAVRRVYNAALNQRKWYGRPVPFLYFQF